MKVPLRGDLYKMVQRTFPFQHISHFSFLNFGLQTK